MNSATHKHGCFNRAPYAAEQVLHGISSKTGERITIHIPNRMQPTCQYSKLIDHPHCDGCEWKEVVSA